MEEIGFPETSGTTTVCCVTSQKSKYFIYYDAEAWSHVIVYLNYKQILSIDCN
jgi:hypothetical protein